MRHAIGPLCSIDVGDRSYEREDVDDVLESFVGGRAVGTKLAHDRIPFDADYERLLEIGGRVVDMERHFNNRRGMDRADDDLPYDLPNFEAALAEYYAERGWNDDGTVPEARVADSSAASD